MALTVVITGAGAGVGRATAVEFARRGAHVALLARGRERLDAAAREVRAHGVEALAIPVDVADAAAVDEAAARVERELGAIDVWVNVAMATVFAPVHAIAPDEFRRVTEVTYLGQVYGTMAALKRMRPRDRGTIVQVGSALSYRAIPLQSAYCGAKFAIRGFTDALRSELLHDKSRVRLTMVQLPAVNTPQFDWARNKMPRRAQPVPPIYQPEAIAREIVRAADRAPRELWIGYPALKAIIGTLLLPRVADRMLAEDAYGGQMTQEPSDPHRPDNLFTPVPGDPGAHGRFDRRAHPRVIGFDPALLRAGALLGLLGALAGAFALGHIEARATARSAARRTLSPPLRRPTHR
ncbi:SDR family oxidoreductase [Rhodoplanes sp. TEM]|uniref:SDR family oxidoreductase n=1 Tax=Rhodoplanes tepidamans TaxID=200616 RepID=A0ABT5J704_RHOTP|nr:MULTISPECIES: SDR family oxidoreductase [Rhodoplanes]MDC7785427.1 SDR family oxidoreductase [Rhodoplanes tepidamans]MDC7985792.1 SDR family oxidoreductase [Rhodoplanes sp. TEM]MDQ0353119.1 short-subunit dehydrogenase [Rhodoplanes tepidamans]